MTLRSLLFASHACLTPALAFGAENVYDIPRLDGVEIDGDPADWSDSGFRVEVLVGPNAPPPRSDFEPAFRLAWDERGLLVLVKVRDDVWDEADEAAGLWRKDGVELFLANRRGGAEMMQVMLAPGLAEAQPELRLDVHDKRASAALRAVEFEPQAARSRTEGGYVMEVLLPWDGIGVDAARGAEAGFQVYISDTDGDARYRAQWAAGAETSNNSTNTNRIRLADAASDPVTAVASARYDDRFGGIDIVTVFKGEGEQRISVKVGDEHSGSLAVRGEEGRGIGKLRVPLPQAAGPQAVEVSLNDRHVSTIDLADPHAVRARHIAQLAPTAKPAVFSGAAFPPVEFNEPTWAERLIGHYTIETRYFNAAHEEVGKPDSPGRYGAVATITGERGDELTRFVTLYKTAEAYDAWDDHLEGSLALPAAIGVEPSVVAEQQEQVLDHATWAFAEYGYREDWTARLLAGLAETPAGAGRARSWNNGEALNRQWWVDHKRAHNGNAERFTVPLQRPHPIGGAPAPTLREGSAADAGMAPDAVQKIDAVLAEWANDSDQAFIACVVRKGVVVLHKAYGQRGGEPMTTETQSWMASITKLVSGTALMMLVDQGLVSLGDPVEQYLPELAPSGSPLTPQLARPATLHHLVTHTAGTWGHWGDDVSDFEHRVGGLYPYLAVGEKHEYNGMSLSLASKVIEQVTGEALPQFLRNRLTAPLGMEHTDVSDSAAGTRSTAYDMAIFGQMLLNKGAYGEHRFFSEETFAQMLPRKLDALLGPDTEIVWGVGCTLFPEHGLGESTFGHGAASNATLRIDPERQLVVTMTRNAAGKNFGTHHPRFIRAVVESIVAE